MDLNLEAGEFFAAFRGEGEANLAGWTTLGLYEMTRKRDRLPLAALLGGGA